jgi:glutathione synthase/RimK-type ligase-like ATP-grasp enzyme
MKNDQPKKILVLSRREERPDFDTADSMAQFLAAAGTDVQYDACFLEEVAFIYDGTTLSLRNMRNDLDIASYDGIFLLGWFKWRKHEEVALSVSLFARRHNIKIYNSEALYNRSRGKLSQYVQSVLQGVPVTPFVVVGDKKYTETIIEQSILRYPLIVKSITGSRGSRNYLVHDSKELAQALTDARKKTVVVQTFVPNDGDYRVLVMGDAVRMVIHRRASGGSHLNNTSQGGQATIVDISTLPQAMLEDSVKIAHALHREITGVDMIIHRETGEYFFLEANNMPQLSTGSFVIEKTQTLAAYFEQWVSDDAPARDIDTNI